MMHRGPHSLITVLSLVALLASGAHASTDTRPQAPSKSERSRHDILHDGSAPSAALIRQIQLQSPTHHGAPSASARSRPLVWAVGNLNPKQQDLLLRRVSAGASAIVLYGSKPPATGPLAATIIAGSQKHRITIASTPAASESLRERVIWNSAPQVGARLRLLKTPGTSLLTVADKSTPLLSRRTLGKGQLYLFTLAFDDPSNRDLKMWPYFGYLLHVLASDATGRAPASYGQWEGSPLPKRKALMVLLAVIASAWVLTFILFFRARRYSKAHPELIEDFFPPAEASPPDDADSDGVSTGPAGATKPRLHLWASIGFARPLAGFMTLTAALLLLFVPFYWLTNIIMPNHVQPFPQARGMWDFAWDTLQVAWFLFDAGTFVAFIKYFAEFRIKEPMEAIRSAQFFVWWQILTGLVQITLASVAAVVILPNTRYGFSTSFVILVALGQYPGFFGVITFFFQAYQRYDYNIALDLLSDWVLRFALTIPFILLFRQWGANNPAYGEAFGAAIGIGVGFHVASLTTFLIGVLLYRRLGLSLLPLFLVHFGRRTAKRMLWYGLRVVAGKFLFRAAQAIDKVMISVLLVNYIEWSGLQGQIHTHLMFLFPLAYRFFETAMAAFSESYGNGKKVLTQYYIVRFFQVGSIYTAIVLSLMFALGPLFVSRVMDPQWARAADFLILAGIVGAFSAPAWLSDMLQKGAGRPGLFAMILGVEQALRIGLFALLIPLWGFWGFYLSILGAIIVKVGGGWLVNHLMILRIRIFPYQMFIAPALGGLLNFAIWRFVGALLATASATTITAVFFAASLFSFISAFFFTGLLGGYDEAFSDELNLASGMTGPLKPLSRLLYHAARLGWTLSPWHNRFPVAIAEEAMAEAADLDGQLLGISKGRASDT